MAAENLQGIVHTDPEIMGGTPVFVGTRVPLQNLIDALEGGESIEDFLMGPMMSTEMLTTSRPHKAALKSGNAVAAFGRKPLNFRVAGGLGATLELTCPGSAVVPAASVGVSPAEASVQNWPGGRASRKPFAFP